MTASNNTAGAILEILRGEGSYLSGEELGRRLGISRAAVWKAIQRLRRQGYRIEAQLGRGYRLLSPPRGLNVHEIRRGLGCKLLGRKVHLAEEVASTNTWAFERALKGAEEGEVFLAEAQSGGKGRMGRRWFSPPGVNLYLSVVLRPRIPPAKVPLLTLTAAVAAAEAVEEVTGLLPEIKWPNDLLLKGKKFGGILAEARAEADLVDFVILGIGINVNLSAEELPDEIAPMATSLKEGIGREVDRVVLLRELLKRLERWYLTLVRGGGEEVLKRWEELAAVRGREVEVKLMGERLRGVVMGVDEDGALLLHTPSGVKRVVAGDLKVRRW